MARRRAGPRSYSPRLGYIPPGLSEFELHTTAGVRRCESCLGTGEHEGDLCRACDGTGSRPPKMIPLASTLQVMGEHWRAALDQELLIDDEGLQDLLESMVEDGADASDRGEE